MMVRRALLGSLLATLAAAAPAAASFTQEPGSSYPVGAHPYGVLTLDVNSDGRPDVVTVNGEASSISVLLRKATGGFAAATPYAVGNGPNFGAAADFTGDGKVDLAVANFPDASLSILGGQGNGAFPPVLGYSAPNPVGVTAGDFNGDGKPDIAVGNVADSVNSPVTMLVSQPAGGFAAQGGLPAAGINHRSLVAADFNLDGRADLAVANGIANTVTVLIRQPGAGVFAVEGATTVGSTASGLAVADFNGDGRPDLAVTNQVSGSVSVLLRNATAGFSSAPNSPYAVGAAPVTVAAGDFNSDGKVDLATGNNGSSTVSVLLNTGDNFTPDPSSPIPSDNNGGAYGVSVADFDGDTRPDLAVGNDQSSRVTILLNTTPPPAGPPPPNLDADGDGVQTPSDCNDANPAIRPGATDVPGDGVDQDCSGADAKFSVIARSIAGLWATFAGPYTKFTALTVKPARAGDTVKLTCKGPGCRKKGKTVRVKKNKPKLSMLKYLKGAHLRKGAVVRLRVTRPATIGRVNTWTIRAPKAPKLVRRCVRPGAKKLSRCPA